MAASDVLGAVVLAGLLGMTGQGVRAVAGLKKLKDQAQATSQSMMDLFAASRLVVSLIIGFVAGMIAGISIGLENLQTINPDNVQMLLGIAAAGYAGTDFIEAFASNLTKVKPPPVLQFNPPPVGGGGPQPPAASGVFNPQYGVTFSALVPGGFFSANPNDVRTQKSIRTNNPGALNISSWQRTRPGFVGTTSPDSSVDRNVTTIYRTPEHGAAAWYFRLARTAGSSRQFTIEDLAVSYAGDASSPLVDQYKSGWRLWSTRFAANPLEPGTVIRYDDLDQMLLLAKCMFAHEAGVKSPVHDDQILFAMKCESDGTLPA